MKIYIQCFIIVLYNYILIHFQMFEKKKYQKQIRKEQNRLSAARRNEHRLKYTNELETVCIVEIIIQLTRCLLYLSFFHQQNHSLYHLNIL